jgi:hypothetical protein
MLRLISVALGACRPLKPIISRIETVAENAKREQQVTPALLQGAVARSVTGVSHPPQFWWIAGPYKPGGRVQIAGGGQNVTHADGPVDRSGLITRLAVFNSRRMDNNAARARWDGIALTWRYEPVRFRRAAQHATVAQSAEATRLERAQCGFESLGWYKC